MGHRSRARSGKQTGERLRASSAVVGRSHLIEDWISRLAGRATVTDDGCWIVGSDADAYHQAMVAGQRVPLHRLVYELMVGDIPKGNHVHHDCEQPACINPEHLRSVSPSEHGRTHADRRWIA